MHERLHLHPVLRPLTMRRPQMAGYLGAVRALYGFVIPMEPRLGDEAAGRAARAPLLAADLRCLTSEGDGSSSEPPLAEELPELASPAARLGCRWVLDGSAQGGRAMLGHLQRSLGVGPDRGAAYFASAAVDLAAERLSLRDHLERHVTTEETCREAVEAAEATFAALERWLDQLHRPSRTPDHDQRPHASGPGA
ncbi:biliverdin-producing heme oxygenase [Skermanella stibiiresistens]|uniref:biliverdin-producing heme oxygenase n=1 Tax=Skermanella stibiiresistens TaxID=913326 RepID=UPI0004B503EA|nr:biliverdin-producing heme oxygenase [Skermanella stibiiresistens]